MKDFLGGTIILTLIACLLGAASLLPSWVMHASDVADLKQVDRVVIITQEEYSKASKRLDKLKEGGSIRFNADTPINSLTNAQINIANKLIKAKVKKTVLVSRIYSRCLGPWAPVVWITDTVTCDEYRNM